MTTGQVAAIIAAMWQAILASSALAAEVHPAVFLVSVLGVSLSGVLAPGPMTSATIAAGLKNRHAGALVAVGHAVIEFPLMVLIVAGIGALFQSRPAQVGIGLAGGVFMAVMGLMMLGDLRKDLSVMAAKTRGGPVMTGIILTAANPYFLLWWATVGMALALQARALGALAFVLFAVLHWLCDLFWLEFLSLASHKGGRVFGPRNTKIILGVCAAAMLAFAVMFIIKAMMLMTAPPPT